MHFLITAGGTREYLDPVRFISNASSGKMGFALARAALKAGHRVTIVAAPTSQRPPTGTRVVKVESAAQMFEAVKKHFPQCDGLIMAAAVSDYTPAMPAKSKIKRSDKSLTIKIKPTVDILKWVARNKRTNQFVVGFALEDKKLRERAEKKLKEKNLDMIVANTVAAIDSAKSSVHVRRPDSRWAKIDSASKTAVARKIVAEVEKLVSAAVVK